ncbi:uncharacterized protein KQ657_003174 [Scheffersomyces spartinae]|uniref:Ubiquitin carboxyl-terminal hydrolase n=1 Tax=Scheffersomyces spartinae TaxID=45513 RepID=A0A9P7VDP8_9ASCO|nr:uncharacterized protein KQ657_003174 [Scheffersomyces spartinae]KAG7195416.1 hypothetical protein KQ657_003174 [Scheffersomyces spartinae]
MSGWNTIDSDAGVFTELVEKLGVQDVQVDELLLIDTESLQALGSVYGVIFLFKYGSLDRQMAQENKLFDGQYDKSDPSPVFFAQQTIQNACATQAVLNILLNQPQTAIALGENLTDFKLFVTGFDPTLVGDTIGNNELIRKVHNSFSVPNIVADEDLPLLKEDADESKGEGVYHFISFIHANGAIYELDGLRQYPIKHDLVNNEQEFLEKLPNVIHRRIAHYNANELRFSLLAMTNNKLAYYESIGDVLGLEQELSKREAWSLENELRRYNHLFFTVELLKGIMNNNKA